MKRLDYFRTYIDALTSFQSLSDEQAGKLFKAKCEYTVSLTEPNFDNDVVLKFAWSYEKARMDRDFKSFYVNCVYGMYGAYCKTCKPDTPMIASDWVAWQKNPDNKVPIKHPIFDKVDPEDFLTQKPKASGASDNYDQYDY